MSEKKPDRTENLPTLGRALLFVEKDSAIKKMIIAVAVICALLFAADLVYHRHGKFEIEHIPGIYGFFGFLAFSFIVLSTKYLKRLIGRDETYYGDGAIDSESYPDRGLDVKDHGDA